VLARLPLAWSCGLLDDCPPAEPSCDNVADSAAAPMAKPPLLGRADVSVDVRTSSSVLETERLVFETILAVLLRLVPETAACCAAMSVSKEALATGAVGKGACAQAGGGVKGWADAVVVVFVVGLSKVCVLLRGAWLDDVALVPTVDMVALLTKFIDCKAAAVDIFVTGMLAFAPLASVPLDRLVALALVANAASKFEDGVIGALALAVNAPP
jgi:hypothetical protein